MKTMKTKKALLLLDKTDTAKCLQAAEELWEQGYDLYATGEMVLFYNQNMIPVSFSPEGCQGSFDCVVG